jgi:hypothetical protein
MKLTRTVAATLLASTLLVAPAEAGWKSKIIKGTAIAVGGYLLGKASAQAEEVPAEPELMQVVEAEKDTSFLAILDHIAKTGLELSQNKFNLEMCRATEHIADPFADHPNGFDGVFSGRHGHCCIANPALLPEIVAFAGNFDQTADLPDAAGLALAFVTNSISTANVDTFKVAVENKKNAVEACLVVAKRFQSLQ